MYDTHALRPLQQSAITSAEHFKRTAHSVHYNSYNVCKFLKAVDEAASKGRYYMTRQAESLPLDVDEKFYLESQGFYIKAEVVSWG